MVSTVVRNLSPRKRVAAAAATVVTIASLGLVTATVEGVFTATPRIFTPPASIDATCSVDDTQALGAWLLTVPNGTSNADSVIRLASHGCYEIDGTIWWRGAREIRIDGNGSSFKQATPSISTAWATVGGSNRATVDPYCGSRAYANSRNSAITTQPMMLVFEGGCDITINNLMFQGTHPGGRDPGRKSVTAFYQTCSFLTFYGTQRVLVQNTTMTGPYGDFIEISGLHEAAKYDGDYPSTDVTVEHSTFKDAGRTGISETNGAKRILITGNTFDGAHLTLFDIEYDSTVDEVIESDINITGNQIEGQNGAAGYGFLLSAKTGSELQDIAFTNNTLTEGAQIKIDLAPNNEVPGSNGNVLIQGNTATVGSSWPFNPVTVSHMENVLVDNNSDPPQQADLPFANLNASDSTNVACNNSNPVTGEVDSACPDSLPMVTPPVMAALPG